MPFLLAKILNFQGTVHLIGVGSLSKKIKRMIDKCKDYNDELKRLETESKKAGLYSPTDPKDNSALNYHLHVKLIESYVHEYQTLKALNRFMEEKISDVKKQIEEKNNK